MDRQGHARREAHRPKLSQSLITERRLVRIRPQLLRAPASFVGQ